MMFTRPNVHCEIRIAFVGASPCSVPPKAHCRGAAPRTSVEGFDKDDLRLAGLRRGRLGLPIASGDIELDLVLPTCLRQDRLGPRLHRCEQRRTKEQYKECWFHGNHPNPLNAAQANQSLCVTRTCSSPRRVPESLPTRRTIY